MDAQAFQGWTETDNPWTHDDEAQNGKFLLVNILFVSSSTL
jgi:ERO1-like protein alpha